MNNLWEATAEPPPESERLAGNRSADVAVIGAGFTGCAAALRLAQASTDVCVEEIDADFLEYAHGGAMDAFNAVGVQRLDGLIGALQL